MSGESLIPQCVYALQVCFFVWSFFYVSILAFIRLSELGLFLLLSSYGSHAYLYLICLPLNFTIQPSLAPHHLPPDVLISTPC